MNTSCQLCPSFLLARRRVRQALRALARDPSVSIWTRERIRARLPLKTPAAARAMLSELESLVAKSPWLGPSAGAAVDAAAAAVRAAAVVRAAV